MSMGDEIHNKIQLLPEDVQYLKAQFLEVADSKINLNLPTNNAPQKSKDEDPLRARVRELVLNVSNSTKKRRAERREL